MNNFITIIPPLLVLVIAIVTRRVILSLGIGIFLSAFIATKYSILNSIELIFYTFISETQIDQLLNTTKSPDHLYTFFFLIALGIIITLITKVGGVNAYTKAIQSKIESKKSVEITALLLSSLLFIDEYLNNLTVGCITRPLADRFKIPRVKLAFIFNSIGSALCVLIPASSWVAMIVANLKTSGVTEKTTNQIQYINTDPFNAYLHSIPYNFYAFFIILTAYFVILKGISFGPMRIQEQIAELTGNCFGGKEEKKSIAENCANGSIWDFLTPISIFLATVMISLLYTGQWQAFGGNNSLFQAFQEADSFYSLFIASVVGILTCIIMFTFKNKLTIKEFFIATKEGFFLMKSSLAVLLLAWIFGTILQEKLHAGDYLADILLGSLPITTLPIVIFITAVAFCAATGSAWGTISIMTPLAIPIVASISSSNLPSSMPLLYPIIGAMLSGALVGGHISPITDSTIIASTSSNSYHLDHVITQIIYSIPAILATIISIIVISILDLPYGIKALLGLTIGSIITLTILYLLDKIYKNKNN